MNQIDIRTHDDIQRLTGAIQELKGMLLLIYSDQCGHCHTYRPFWKKLHNIKNRKMGLVSVERSMLPHTPWANVEHRGYPSVIQIDEEGKAHPVENIRDEKNMNAVVNGDTKLNEPELEESSSDEDENENENFKNSSNKNSLVINNNDPEPLNETDYLNVLNSQEKLNPTTLGNSNSQAGGRRRAKKRISKKKTIRKRRGRKQRGGKPTRRQKQKNLKRR